MSIFNDNITSEINLKEKVRAYIDDILDNVADLVNNHFIETKLHEIYGGSMNQMREIYGYPMYSSDSDTTIAFINETNIALGKFCKSEFGCQHELLITKPISLLTLTSTPLKNRDSWTKYKVKVVIDHMIEQQNDAPISDSLYSLYYTVHVNTEFFYEKIIYNHPH